MRKTESYKSTCSYCGVGCGIIVHKRKDQTIAVEGDPEHPVNRGMLCSKGMNLHHTVNNKSDRILSPMARWGRNHPLERTDWGTAIQRAAAVFKAIIRKFGPDSVGFYVSGQCLTEEYYIANKLVKGFIGTNNIDTNSRLCMSSAVAGYVKTLGEDAVPIAYDDIELADCFLIAGANPAWCHPILFRRLEQHKAKNPETKLIVVDPRKTQSASTADLHLQINPGTDIFLYNAIAKILIEQGLIDHDFILDHTEGFESYKKSVADMDIQEAADVCGVAVYDILKAAGWIGRSKGFITMWAMGLNQSVIGLKKNLALISLNLITGQIGKPGAGPFSLTGQPNAMGGREVGGMASLLAAHYDLANPEHRNFVSSYWKSGPISPRSGLTATQMTDAMISGDLKAIWIVCTNPMVSLPDARMAEKALQTARFVVVQDISMNSDTVKMADLVLPAAGCFEKEGTMTNSERRISYLQKAVEPPGEALPDVEILCRFAKAMGYSGFDYAGVSEIYDEYARLTKGRNIDVSGLNYERLKTEGSFQWPVRSRREGGQARLFSDKKFYTHSGKAQLYPLADMANDSEPLTEDFPLILTTGRIRDQWHTMTKTGKVKKLTQHIARPFLEIHPEDAAARGIRDNDIVAVANRRGEITAYAKATTDIKKGVVFLPMHWGKTFGKDFSRANNLTNNLVDPVSKEPDFKFSAVDVKRVEKAREKIIVVGAGAAAFQFINTYRELNRDDEILVFSKEKHAFYNRVALPEYINDHLRWQDLLKCDAGFSSEMNISLLCEKTIVKIDRKQKAVYDSDGFGHSYDKLVLATGSKPFVPKEVDLNLPNVFTIRTKRDADNLKRKIPEKGSALVIGGGLLGLEIAASLSELDLEISIVQLPSRLMIRQLDQTASDLLREEIEDRGIKVYCNDQAVRIESKTFDHKLYSRLKSGVEIVTDIVVVAVGTRPHLDLATESGLECGRGVIVNRYLQTSDPAIYAIGEIAEFEGQLYGTTLAAEQQASVLARHMNGDPYAHYGGSVKMNILKFSDLDLCSIGVHEKPAEGAGYEEIFFMDKSRKYYKKCIVKDDALIGAVLMGDKNEFVEYKELIESGIELGEKRDQLLRASRQGEPLKGKLVCSCNRVGEGNLEDLIDRGVEKFDDICSKSGAGSGCGSCRPEVKAILERKLAAGVAAQTF